MNINFRTYYSGMIKELHSIIESEMVSSGTPDEVVSCVSFISSINSFGLISKEVIDELLKKYENDSMWRRLWGSVATQFEFYLRSQTELQAKDVADFVISALDVEDRFQEATSLTQVELASSRVGLTGTNGLSLNNINDFWMICVFMFRLTSHLSEICTEITSRNFEEAGAPAANRKK